VTVAAISKATEDVLLPEMRMPSTLPSWGYVWRVTTSYFETQKSAPALERSVSKTEP
jgi:hypothetical protein